MRPCRLFTPPAREETPLTGVKRPQITRPERLVRRQKAAREKLADKRRRVAIEVDVAVQQVERLLLAPAQAACARGRQPLFRSRRRVLPQLLEAEEKRAWEAGARGRLPHSHKAHAQPGLDGVLEPVPEGEGQLKVGEG